MGLPNILLDPVRKGRKGLLRYDIHSNSHFPISFQQPQAHIRHVYCKEWRRHCNSDMAFDPFQSRKAPPELALDPVCA
jgi:hypothetical protein